MGTKEKLKSFSLSGWFKSKFTSKHIAGPEFEKSRNINDSLINTDEWPLQEDSYHTYTKFNNEGFYN